MRVFVLLPGRTTVTGKERYGEHKKPLAERKLSANESFQFTTKGVSCIGAIVITVPEVSNLSELKPEIKTHAGSIEASVSTTIIKGYFYSTSRAQGYVKEASIDTSGTFCGILHKKNNLVKIRIFFKDFKLQYQQSVE